MAEEVFANVRAITDLEDGIRTFGHQMADTNHEIEHTIDLYFQDFQRGLLILEERLHRAEENLERAERALERQRNKRVWVDDNEGEGHWEPADCSTEEARVARCRIVYDKCYRNVTECRNMISDARTKRYIHEEYFSQLAKGITEAADKIGPVKELVEKHQSISVPSPSLSSSRGSFGSFSSSASAPSISRKIEMPRPPIPQPSLGPKPTPSTERPRSPQNESINPMPNSPITENDRPRSPFDDGKHVARDNALSFWEDIRRISEDYQNKKSK